MNIGRIGISVGVNLRTTSLTLNLGRRVVAVSLSYWDWKLTAYSDPKEKYAFIDFGPFEFALDW